MGHHSEFSHLLSPGRIGTLETRNRIFMSPMGTNLGEGNGYVGERKMRYLETRAQGGAGLVTFGVGAIDFPNGAAIPRQIGISKDDFLPGLKDLAERIHRHGAKAAVQLQHAGKNAVLDIAAGRPLMVPSEPSEAIGGMADVTAEEMQAMVKNLTAEGAKIHYNVMTTEDIAWLTDRFADAADRAKRAGFDAIEIHAGHGYVLSSFLSPASNKRTDQYGGSVENRSRILVEVMQAVKQRVGNDFPVWFRIDAREFHIENGITLEDACKTARIAEEAGADAIHVSAYANPALGHAFTEAPLVHEAARYLPFAEQIKREVKIPIIGVGRIEPQVGDRAIRDGKVDFIAMGRKLLADPELPNKLTAGKQEDIRPCIYCYTCVGKIFLNETACCAANPAMGKEDEFEIVSASKAKTILIVGGGPAGMEAARIAALRGHRVTLCERENQLGGTAFFASIIYPENGQLVDHLKTQIQKLPIDLHLGQEVTVEFIKQMSPDHVLLAQGAKRQAPPIPGSDRRNVFTGDDLRELVTGAGGKASQKLSIGQRALVAGGSLLGITRSIEKIRKMSKLWMPLGKRTVIIGGGLVGIELAGFLAERGLKVTVLEEEEYLAPEMSLPRRWRVLHELRGQGVSMLTGVRIEEILEKEVAFVTKEGNKEAETAESVILATGAMPDQGLFDQINVLGYEANLIGDCREIGYIEGAMADGARAGGQV